LSEADADAELGKRAKKDKKIRKNTEQRLFPMQCDRTVTLLSIMDGAEEVGT
jgi:hypothetical protein